ncbi:MAG: YihY/virulence factor BrkB family protein, partial [Thermoanaerobaculia bacterium]|nr:YihY/virulence factor BrkB family protein [Thermoanaerobaculia bacterium]
MSDDNRQLQLPRVRSDFVGAFREWGKDNAPQFAAAIAFYAILSLGPLLVFSISIAAIFFESEAARGEIVGSVQQYIGRGAAEMVQEVIENASERKGGLFASIFGFVVLAFGASRIFQQLKIALNVILDVPDAEEGGIMKMALDRLFSILAVVGFGLFLMASLILNTILGRLDDAIAIPGGSFVWQVLSQALSLALMAVVFALILRYLPDTDTPWKYVWEGAVLAAALFTIGQIVISLYLSQTEPGSSFGAAGPVIVVIVWIYFTTVMFFFSAEFM